jgi:hypothetical protein
MLDPTDPERAPRRRPDGVTDATVAAHGKLSEGLEYVHRIRGAMYEMHQLMGRADFLFEDAADELAAAGHIAFADELRQRLVGRNVLGGRWTFQIVEEFDDTYYSVAVDLEREVRDALLGGWRHVFESELKEERRTPGEPAHESRPIETVAGRDAATSRPA